MAVTMQPISRAIDELGLSGKPVCIHSSLSSFGWIEGGARTVIDGFLHQHCTLLVPAFSWSYAAAPPLHLRPLRNGCGDYSWFSANYRELENNIYHPLSNVIDTDMGMLPRAVLHMENRERGDHPLNSFAGVGPLAKELVSEQKPDHVYAPLKFLAERDGAVILMGVGFDKLTLLHGAEQMAGRNLFRRWAKHGDGSVREVEVGGCSGGFDHFQSILSAISKDVTVGESLWRVFKAGPALTMASHAIRQNPSITHCGDSGCDRCNDAVLGGPIL